MGLKQVLNLLQMISVKRVGLMFTTIGNFRHMQFWINSIVIDGVSAKLCMQNLSVYFQWNKNKSGNIMDSLYLCQCFHIYSFNVFYNEIKNLGDI